jgi:hypothetical protein
MLNLVCFSPVSETKILSVNDVWALHNLWMNWARSLCSSVSMETRLRAVRQGFNSRQGQGLFLFVTASRPALRLTQPPIQWVPGTLTPEVKQLWREADHLPPSSAEVKNAWSYTSTLPYSFMACCLVEHRGNFTFILPYHQYEESGYVPDPVFLQWKTWRLWPSSVFKTKVKGIIHHQHPFLASWT